MIPYGLLVVFSRQREIPGELASTINDTTNYFNIMKAPCLDADDNKRHCFGIAVAAGQYIGFVCTAGLAFRAADFQSPAKTLKVPGASSLIGAYYGWFRTFRAVRGRR